MPKIELCEVAPKLRFLNIQLLKKEETRKGISFQPSLKVMEQRTQFCLLGLVFFLFYCSLCEPVSINFSSLYTRDMVLNHITFIVIDTVISCYYFDQFLESYFEISNRINIYGLYKSEKK